MTTDQHAADLIRSVVSGTLSERQLDSEWPEAADAEDDIANSRNNVIALYEARRNGDTKLSKLLEDDLTDAADALEGGRPLEWFEVTPRWSRAAHSIAFAVGFIGWGVAFAEGWPWWSKWIPLVVALGAVWVAEWMWEQRQP